MDFNLSKFHDVGKVAGEGGGNAWIAISIPSCSAEGICCRPLKILLQTALFSLFDRKRGCPINVFTIFLFSSFPADATLDKSSHLMFVEYSVSEPARDEAVAYSMLPIDETNPFSSGILIFLDR